MRRINVLEVLDAIVVCSTGILIPNLVKKYAELADLGVIIVTSVAFLCWLLFTEVTKRTYKFILWVLGLVTIYNFIFCGEYRVEALIFCVVFVIYEISYPLPQFKK